MAGVAGSGLLPVKEGVTLSRGCQSGASATCCEWPCSQREQMQQIGMATSTMPQAKDNLVTELEVVARVVEHHIAMTNK